jgi:hypothetical protein
MANNTWIELQPNDPIFSNKLEISALPSRPSTTSSLPNTDGTKPKKSRSQDPNYLASRLYDDAISALLLDTEPNKQNP